MGTRADFYLGRGLDAQWLGSIAWDGHPSSIDSSICHATTLDDYLNALSAFFTGRDDVSGPDHGWPWPWDTSHMTDYAYAFDEGRVWACYFGYRWWPATEDEPDDHGEIKTATFPNMSSRKNVTWDERSGLIIMRQKGDR